MNDYRCPCTACGRSFPAAELTDIIYRKCGSVVRARYVCDPCLSKELANERND